MDAEASKDAFKAGVRQVMGSHSSERTLQRRVERMEARKRAIDHAATPDGGTSVQDAVDLLQGLQAATIGTDVGTVSAQPLKYSRNAAATQPSTGAAHLLRVKSGFLRKLEEISTRYGLPPHTADRFRNATRSFDAPDANNLFNPPPRTCTPSLIPYNTVLNLARKFVRAPA